MDNNTASLAPAPLTASVTVTMNDAKFFTSLLNTMRDTYKRVAIVIDGSDVYDVIGAHTVWGDVFVNFKGTTQRVFNYGAEVTVYYSQNVAA